MSRTYESRYAERRRKTGYSGGAVVFILLCCALAVFLLSTSYLGDKLVDRYITPTFAKIMGKTVTAEPDQVPVMANVRETVPSASPAVERIVFELPETSWYLLQMGAYADPEEAHVQAQTIQSMAREAISMRMSRGSAVSSPPPMRIRKACCRFSSRSETAAMRIRRIPFIPTAFR